MVYNIICIIRGEYNDIGGIMNEEQFTLERLNRLRKSAGHQLLSTLPAGEQRTPGNCVIARALQDIDPTVVVFSEGIFTDNKEFARIIANSFGHNYELDIVMNDTRYQFGVAVPLPMASFIENFDEGLYPELVLSN